MMKRVNKNQSGMISLVICMLLMIVISLMTLSFAALSRREQRQALDKQLSTQAFYAAETGINDASKSILDGTLIGDISDCSPEQQGRIKLGDNTSIPDTLDTNSSVSRTCVFVDQTPTQIDDVVGESASTVFLISATNLASLDIYWENDTPVATPVFPAIDTSNGSFPADAAWNSSTPGVLIIQLIPAPPTSKADIANRVRYVLGFPAPPPASAAASGTGSNGSILGGGCATTNTSTPTNWPRQCKVTISGLGGLKYYIRLKAIYDPVHVSIEGKDGSNNRLPFVGAQVLIDSTGRAGDVTKRLKIYKPLRASASLPSSVLEIGDDLCKRLQANPASPNGATTDSSIPSCDPSYQP